MMLALIFGLTLVELICYAMIVAGMIGVALIVMARCGVTVPQWIQNICWIVLAVAIGIVAVKFLASLI